MSQYPVEFQERTDYIVLQFSDVALNLIVKYGENQNSSVLLTVSQ